MKIVKIISYVLVTLLVGTIFWEIPRLISINKITCSSQFGPCSGEIADIVGKARNKNLHDAEAFLGKKVKENKMIIDTSIQFKIPDTLSVDIILRKPKFSLSSGGKFVLVDKDGVVVSFTQSSNLPTVIVDGGLPDRLGEKVEESKLFTLEIMSGLNRLYQVATAKIEGQSLVVELPLGQTVIFPLEGDSEVLIGSLRLILGSLTSGKIQNGLSVKTIDLRFKNPVLR